MKSMDDRPEQTLAPYDERAVQALMAQQSISREHAIRQAQWLQAYYELIRSKRLITYWTRQ